jgi:putative PIN family toxin of toxin-antitoxin system
MIRVVLDTNVLVAGLMSRDGASSELLRRIGRNSGLKPCVSVPLVFEYEAALKRKFGTGDERIAPLLDYICLVGDRQEIYFLWRPFLRDPGDEMVLEVAVGGAVSMIVTHNLRDFSNVEEQFGIRVVTPGVTLMEMEGLA